MATKTINWINDKIMIIYSSYFQNIIFCTFSFHTIRFFPFPFHSYLSFLIKPHFYHLISFTRFIFFNFLFLSFFLTFSSFREQYFKFSFSGAVILLYIFLSFSLSAVFIPKTTFYTLLSNTFFSSLYFPSFSSIFSIFRTTF